MALTLCTDSYVTVVDADAYFLAGYGYGDWALLDETTKEQALRSAYQQLNAMCEWIENPCVDGESEIPQNIKDAQCEIAYAIISTNSTSTDGGDSVSELTAGPVTLKFNASSSTQNPLVNDLTSQLLKGYGLCSGGGSTKLIPISRQ